MKLDSTTAAGVLASTQKTQTLLLALFFAVGTVSHLISWLRPWMTLLTPFVLVMVGLLAVAVWWSEQTAHGGKIALWIVATYVVTFALEALGTHTGMVFGAYTYGHGLGPRFVDVPLVIGFNWTIVVLGSHGLVSGLRWSWARVLGTALICVAFDVVMEPVAMDPRMDYWSWAGGEVPLQNYLAWFVIAALAALGLEALRLRPAGLFARAFVVVQAVFFGVLWAGFRFGGFG